jgi:hypothetical protein
MPKSIDDRIKRLEALAAARGRAALPAVVACPPGVDIESFVATLGRSALVVPARIDLEAWQQASWEHHAAMRRLETQPT